MRIRTFQGSSFAETISLVREAMGPDAIILSSHERRRGGGVEIRAAVEEARPEPAPVDPAYAGIAKRLAARLEAEMRAALPPSTGVPAETHHAGARRRLGKGELRALYQSLQAQGFSRAGLVAILGKAREAEGASPAEALAQGLGALVKVAPLDMAPKRATVLVGPPGAGKTASLAKIAARAVLARRRPRLVTTDTLRAGAVAQLEAYAGVIGLSAETCETPDRFAALLEEANGEPLLVDTPGTNAFRRSELKDLKQFLSRGALDIVLVISAGSDASEVAEWAAPFVELGARRVLLARCDAARRLGPSLEAVARAGLPLCALGVSPYLAEGLSMPGHDGLAELLLELSPLPPVEQRPAPTPAPSQGIS
ncbi:MAG: hypothetical protein H6923_01625 [Alphaproteobacteria bacterium]|nr:hypothetical protein [Alphaproteobacteria bacterium]